jgi:hypothetical protein
MVKRGARNTDLAQVAGVRAKVGSRENEDELLIEDSINRSTKFTTTY